MARPLTIWRAAVVELGIYAPICGQRSGVNAPFDGQIRGETTTWFAIISYRSAMSLDHSTGHSLILTRCDYLAISIVDSQEFPFFPFFVLKVKSCVHFVMFTYLRISGKMQIHNKKKTKIPIGWNVKILSRPSESAIRIIQKRPENVDPNSQVPGIPPFDCDLT